MKFKSFNWLTTSYKFSSSIGGPIRAPSLFCICAEIHYFNSPAGRFEAKNMHIYRSALSACVMRNMPNVEYYMPLDRDRLSEEGRKNIERNSRQNNGSDLDSTATVDGNNGSANTVNVRQQDRNINVVDENDDDDDVIFV